MKVDYAGDRLRLQGLLGLMKASERALRRDECGDWRINGTVGHVYADGAGFLACFVRDVGLEWTPRKWNSVKRTLPSRFRVSQDGDEEGCVQVREPTAREATRRLLGIRKRREVSPEQLARMRDRLRRMRGQEPGEA